MYVITFIHFVTIANVEDEITYLIQYRAKNLVGKNLQTIVLGKFLITCLRFFILIVESRTRGLCGLLFLCFIIRM
jgi:hypothetical protein